MNLDIRRDSSVRDILNLGITAQMEGNIAILPDSQESAIQFQSTNLSAAVRLLKVFTKLNLF